MPDSMARLLDWGKLSWLTVHLDELLDDPRSASVIEFANDLRTAWTDLRRAAGYHLTAIGYCPVGGCGAELLADQHDDAVVCDGCGTVWAREHWRWLTDTLRSAA